MSLDGKILEVSRLNFDCARCDKPAVLKVRTQYADSLTERVHFFCPSHVPVRILSGRLQQGGEIPK
ncbi:hypothetical protein LCGC14_0251830 [marine sediment metagenome]|uniref:Uncharacterized protein n=1 Tax=marine sediment metagenome TaxID=412755 RepID=A0A0F9WPK3_9ZZZZ